MMGITPESVKKIWDEWEIRLMVVLSLCLQIVLIFTGDKRKYVVSTWFGVIIWLAYLSADSVATVSLSALSRSQTDPSVATITSFWAPFLIVHLGGPDTITAFSLEDNELWLRHLLQLIVQVGVAFYVLMRSWSGDAMSFLVIPVFIPGILKYGERIWVLWSASFKHFRDSLLPEPQAGPDYAAFMEEYNRRVMRGIPIRYGMKIEAPHSINFSNFLLEAYYLFDIFKSLYGDLILSSHEQSDGLRFLKRKSPKDAFKVIEIELGVMYDVLYSKATFAHSRIGMAIRCLSLLSFTSAFITFCLVVDNHSYSQVDVIITYILLAGAIFLEIYAGMLLIFSERTLYRLMKNREWAGKFIYRVIASTPSASVSRKRWCCSMAQYSLMGFCLKEKPSKFERIERLIQVHDLLEKSRYMTREHVTVHLKELIFEKITAEGVKVHHRGEEVLRKKSCLEKFQWSVENIEFDQSILLWHIATDLCFYSNKSASPSLKSQLSKILSDHMLYLLVMRPLMLPKGIGEIRYRDTCAETIRFIQQRRAANQPMSRGDLCRLLLQINTDISPHMVKGDRSKSVLFNACKLAKSLESLVTEEERWEEEEKWDLIVQVWTEMLCYAANHCSWNQHIKQLTQGGELISHVCLLMAHMGLSEQFQISQGDATVHFLRRMIGNRYDPDEYREIGRI